MKFITLNILVALSFVMTGTFTASFITAPTAEAQSSSKTIVDQAIAQGLVGETASGYLQVVSSASPQIMNAVQDVNIGRKSVYTRLARQQNVSVEVVAALTGEKQIAKSPRGSKVLTASGQWMTKS
ncbi:MAG: YdbL family protein [Maricaulaceae bacterium]